MTGWLTKVVRDWGLTRVARIEKLAGLRGSYLVVFRVPGGRIRIGALGAIHFPAGLYGYVGSADGRSVTLAHRLSRHLRRRKLRRWHLDYLTISPGTVPVAAFVAPGGRLSEARLASLCARRFPAVPKFGNSDHRSKAPGHLFLLRPARILSGPAGSKTSERE